MGLRLISWLWSDYRLHNSTTILWGIIFSLFMDIALPAMMIEPFMAFDILRIIYRKTKRGLCLLNVNQKKKLNLKTPIIGSLRLLTARTEVLLS